MSRKGGAGKTLREQRDHTMTNVNQEGVELLTLLGKMDSTPRELREQCGLPRIKVAVDANVSEATLRSYEADRASVTPRTRGKIDPVYVALAKSLQP